MHQQQQHTPKALYLSTCFPGGTQSVLLHPSYVLTFADEEAKADGTHRGMRERVQRDDANEKVQVARTE